MSSTRVLRASALALASILPAAFASAQSTVLVSVGPNGTIGGEIPASGICSGSRGASISADGRRVAFHASCPAFGGGDFNYDVYVRDLVTLDTILVSASMGSPDVGANSDSLSPSISSDGKFVAFSSGATDLVPIDTTTFHGDIYYRNLVAGTTTKVSVNNAGVAGDHTSSSPSLSADGRHVAFESYASNFWPGDTFATRDIFVRDLPTSQTWLVSMDSNGAKANGHCYRAAISQDGRFVAFDSVATNLVAGDTNGVSDVFVRDRILGVTTRVSVDSIGGEGNAASLVPAITPDGRFVAFGSEASNLDGIAPGSGPWIYVHDRQTGQTQRVARVGFPMGGGLRVVALSEDARYVGFPSTDATLVAGDTNGMTDIFVFDRQSSTFERISVGSDDEQATRGSVEIALSFDGRFAAFSSGETSFVVNAGDGGTYIYRRDRQPDPGTSFCFGDGSLATPCPCVPPNTVPNPSGVPDHGCANSFRLEGGELDVTGAIVPDTVRFLAEIGEAYGGFGFLVKGDASSTNGIANGDGVRCVDGALIRFGGHNAHTNGATPGSWAYPNPVQTISVSAATLQSAGQSAYYQLIYRNAAAAFCSSGTTNWTNGVRIDW